MTTLARTTVHAPYVVRGDDPPTPEQLDVLRGIAAGKMHDEIAADMFVSRTTINKRLARLAARLGLNREQVLILAGSRGWISVEQMRD